MFSLTTTHLRFVCEAATPLRLEVENFRAGQNLRGALGQVMARSYCAEPHPSAPLLVGEGKGERSHTASCPVHWLLAANEKPGQERRGYTLVPPMLLDVDLADRPYNPGQRFEFGITLFGDALKFLPYFVLAIPEMGRGGVGAGRGKFALKSVWAVDPFASLRTSPFTRARECLLTEGDNLVHTPTLTINHAQVMDAATRLMQTGIASAAREIASQKSLAMTIHFLTPTRLIEEGKLAQAPAFDVLFARLLGRLDELAQQFCNGERRGGEAAQALQRFAEHVRLIESQTRWVEVWSGSQRSGTASPLSGIVGHAVYAASPDVWEQLLPWLLWGQLAQVGKSAVKGNGVIEVRSMKDEGRNPGSH